MRIDAFLVLTLGGAAIDGESTDTEYRKSIEIHNFKTGGGVGADESMLPDHPKRGRNYGTFGFEIDKGLDAASPYLFRAYCSTFSKRFHPEQNLFRKAEIFFRKAGGGDTGGRGQVYLAMTFAQVILTGYSLTQSSGEMKETVKFAFQTCQLQYQEQTPAGGSQPPKEMKGWSFPLNEPI